MQECENGLCNKPCLNGRQARASGAILTRCEFSVLFTSRHSHTNLASAPRGSGFAEFSVWSAHIGKSCRIQQGSCFMLNHGAPGMLKVRPSGAQQGASEKSTHLCHRYLDAASASPVPPALLAAIPLPLKHPATKNDYFYIFLK